GESQLRQRARDQPRRSHGAAAKLRSISISVLEGRRRIGRIRFADERIPGVWLWNARWAHSRISTGRRGAGRPSTTVMIRRSWTPAASIEETLALWAASLREIKKRIRRNSAGFTHLTDAGEYIHAPDRVAR